MSRIVVSGYGVVSCLGVGADANLHHLKQGISGISDKPYVLSTSHELPVGELRMENRELAERLGLSGGKTVSRTALLGTLAAREALRHAQLGIQPERIGLVSSTSVGGMDLTESFYRQFRENDTKGRLRDAVMHDCGASTAFIAQQCGIGGYSTTISTACSSSANAILHACRLLKHGIADAVVAGGTDALSIFTLNGFKSLMILDENRCRPLDENRNGLNLGEGAAYIVLQRENDARQCYGWVAGCANRNDAYHQTASSEDGWGAYLAMKDALVMADIHHEEISYINLHGTGTRNNDLAESRAVLRLFGNRIPALGSTKVYTGHTLAAAGAIEAVFSLMALREGRIFAQSGFGNPMEETGLLPVREASDCEMNYVLSNSFGFGGNCTSIVLGHGKLLH